MEKVQQTEQSLQNMQQYVDFVKNNLEPLAQHLKVSVEWLWNILVMQARVEAIVYLVVCIFMAMTTITLMTMFFKHLKKTEWHRSNYDMFGGPSNKEGVVALVTGIGAALMLLVSVITTSSNLYVIVTGLVNPEFRAIEKIVEFAKPAAEEAKTKVEVEAK